MDHIRVRLTALATKLGLLVRVRVYDATGIPVWIMAVRGQPVAYELASGVKMAGDYSLDEEGVHHLCCTRATTDIPAVRDFVLWVKGEI